MIVLCIRIYLCHKYLHELLIQVTNWISTISKGNFWANRHLLYLAQENIIDAHTHTHSIAEEFWPLEWNA